jgi:microcystin-dependent protein
MKSSAISNGAITASSQYNSLRDDAHGSSTLLAHAQLGILAIPTNPSNNDTWTLTVNGTAVSGTFVVSIGSTPGNVLIGGSAAVTVQRLFTLLQNPEVTSSAQVALSLGNQQLLAYIGYALNTSNITIYSYNTTTNAQLTSFTASASTTGSSWTASTLKLYVEPGILYIGTTQVKFTGASTPLVTAPVSNPRIDLLTIDTSGTLAWTTGTENASPSAPTYPFGKVPICEIWNVVGETQLLDNANQNVSQGYILNDVRPFNNVIYINDPNQIASGVITNANLNAAVGIMQTGMIVMWTTTSAPAGFVFCDGSSLLRAGTYAALFAVIGTTFGSADGTHFNVPDFRGRVPVGVGTGTGGGASGNGAPTGGSALTARALADWLGEETHTLSSGEMPAHTHNVSVNTTGAGSTTNTINTSTTTFTGNTSVTTSSTGSGTAHNTIQPTIAIEFIIHI